MGLVWDRELIRNTVRDITGRKNASSLSDTKVNTYINRYYTLDFPVDITPRELKSWFLIHIVGN